MSRSRPQLKNPATVFLEFKGGAEPVGKDENGVMQYEGGKLQYYDKSANEGDGETVEVDMPFTFLVLDELTTITGFSKELNSGFYSNEVKDTNKQELVVRNKNGIFARGLYKNIKDELKAAGAKYTRSVYIGYFNAEKELVLGHIKFAGSAFSAWLELNKRVDIYDAAISISVNPKVQTNGTTKYFEPQFETIKISEATGKLADKLDVELQKYLDIYFERGPEIDAEVDEDDDDDNDIHNIPGVDKPADAPAAPTSDETLEDGTSTDAEQEAPQKPSNKPATAAKKAKAADEPKLNDVEF